MKKTIIGYIPKYCKANEVFLWGQGPFGIKVLSGTKVYRRIPSRYKSKYKRIEIIVDVKEVKDEK